MVDPFETDKLMYAESLEDAVARGDQGTADALRDLGEPPYDNTLDYPVAIASNPKWMDFQHGKDYNAASEYPASLFVGEYTLIEQLRGMASIAETYNVLYPQLSDTDFRVDAPRLDVPVYLVEGRHEAAGRETLAREWFNLMSVGTQQEVRRLRELRTHTAVRRARPLRRTHGRRSSDHRGTAAMNATPKGDFRMYSLELKNVTKRYGHEVVFTVRGSAPFARHVAGLVRMLVDAGQFGWAGTPYRGLGQEIPCLRPPFPVPASPMPTPDSGMRTKPATSRATTRSSALAEGFSLLVG
jgi:hypothetical protein